MSPELYSWLTGQDEGHLLPCWSGALVHRQVLAPLEQLHEEARAAGFELAIASSFRRFERQLSIWREKVSGRRSILSSRGELLNAESLEPLELLWAILRWSALPGTSRHHWGTDLDVYDASAVGSDYRLQLTPAEYDDGGVFADFQYWLNERIAADNACGFYRPYDRDRGGVAPEPWHISYRPLADQLMQSCDFEFFEQLLDSGCWPLQEQIRAHAETIYYRYVALPTGGRGGSMEVRS